MKKGAIHIPNAEKQGNYVLAELEKGAIPAAQSAGTKILFFTIYCLGTIEQSICIIV